MANNLPSNGKKLLTGTDLLTMGDPGPCELVKGRLVLAKPAGMRHGGIEGNFYYVLRNFVEERKLGKVLVGEVGVYTGRDPDTVRGADVLFLSKGRYARLKGKTGFLAVAPDLVVEIRSPSERQGKVLKKVREYLARGVRLVWVANPKRWTVRAYRSPTDVREFGGEDLLPGDDVLPGFSVPVASLFE